MGDRWNGLASSWRSTANQQAAASRQEDKQRGFNKKTQDRIGKGIDEADKKYKK